FKSAINGKVLGFAPNCTVTTFDDTQIERADTLTAYLNNLPEVQEAQAVVNGQAMLQSSDQVTGILFRGVDQSGDVTNLEDFIVKGTYSLDTDSSGLPGMVIGQKLAKTLQADINSVLTAYTVEGIPSPLSSPEIQQFRLKGVYQTGIGEFDDSFTMVPRSYAKDLFGFTSQEASRVELNIKDQKNRAEFSNEPSDQVGLPYYVESIYAKYSSIFAWVNLQEETIPFVISVMVIVAAFNLIGTILMMVLERTSDSGILQTMGASAKSIRSIFILEGLFVAIVGLLIGIGLTLLFTWLQSTYHLIPLSEQNYYIAYAPVELHGIDFLWVSLVTLVLCSLASYLPARTAANTNPLKVIAFGR